MMKKSLAELSVGIDAALVPAMLPTARQRLAAFITPIAVMANDGTELLLRPGLPGDGTSYVDGSTPFSQETRYRRFFSGGVPTQAQLAYLFEVNYVDHFVWVVTDDVDRPIIADARFVRDTNNPASAEIALTVADVYQGRGIGTLLLGGLAVAACINGIKQFHARVLADNVAARALGHKLQTRWEPEEPAVLTTTVAVPFLEDSPIELETYQQINHVARQLIHAFGPASKPDHVLPV